MKRRRVLLLLMTVILMIIFESCNQNENGEIAEEISKNIAGVSDVDESKSVSAEFVKRSKEIFDSRKQQLIFYVKPERHKFIYDFYEIAEVNMQDQLVDIFRSIKKEFKVEKKIQLKFYMKENLIQKEQGYYRENEKLLREIEI